MLESKQGITAESDMSKRHEDVGEGFFTVDEACEFLRTTRTTIYKHMNAGVIPWVNLGAGSRRLIPKSALFRMLERNLKGR